LDVTFGTALERPVLGIRIPPLPLEVVNISLRVDPNHGIGRAVLLRGLLGLEPPGRGLCNYCRKQQVNN
jgi:hypothetical protein